MHRFADTSVIEYSVTVRRDGSSRLGLDVEKGPLIRIKAVHEGGVIADWNARTSRPQQRVKPGDLILSVNGATGEREVRRALETLEELRIQLRSGFVRVDAVDWCLCGTPVLTEAQYCLHCGRHRSRGLGLISQSEPTTPGASMAPDAQLHGSLAADSLQENVGSYHRHLGNLALPDVRRILHEQLGLELDSLPDATHLADDLRELDVRRIIHERIDALPDASQLRELDVRRILHEQLGVDLESLGDPAQLREMVERRLRPAADQSTQKSQAEQLVHDKLKAEEHLPVVAVCASDIRAGVDKLQVEVHLGLVVDDVVAVDEAEIRHIAACDGNTFVFDSPLEESHAAGASIRKLAAHSVSKPLPRLVIPDALDAAEILTPLDVHNLVKARALQVQALLHEDEEVPPVSLKDAQVSGELIRADLLTRELEGAHAQLATKLAEAHDSVEAANVGVAQPLEESHLTSDLEGARSRDRKPSLSPEEHSMRQVELERVQAQLAEVLAEQASIVKSWETELAHAEMQNQELRLQEQEQATAFDSDRTEVVALREQLARLEESALQTVEVVQSLPDMPGLTPTSKEVPEIHDSKAFERLEQLLIDIDPPDLPYSADYSEVLRLREQLAKVEEAALETVEAVERFPHIRTPLSLQDPVQDNARPWRSSDDDMHADERLERILLAATAPWEDGPSTAAKAEQLRREAYELRWHMRDWSTGEPSSGVAEEAWTPNSPTPQPPMRRQNNNPLVLQNIIPGMQNIREVAASVIRQLEQNDEAVQAAVLLTAPSPPLPPPPLTLFS